MPWTRGCLVPGAALGTGGVIVSALTLKVEVLGGSEGCTAPLGSYHSIAPAPPSQGVPPSFWHQI